MSGSKVVLAIFGGTLAVALIAVAAFLLTDEENLRCVEGELQDNAVGPDGAFISRVESFMTIEEADAFVCKHIPRPQDSAGFVLSKIAVTRTSNLAGLIEGTGGFFVHLTYIDPEGQQGGLTFQVFSPPFLAPPGQDEGEPVRIGGSEGRLVRTNSGAQISWTRGEYFFHANAGLRDEFDLDAMLAVLRSVR